MAKTHTNEQVENTESVTNSSREIDLSREFIDAELRRARRSWRSLGVWYAGTGEVQSLADQSPEHLLASTAWLFAYDFKLQALVATWLKNNAKLIDIGEIIREMDASTGPDAFLAIAYVYALSVYLRQTARWGEKKNWLILERATQKRLEDLESLIMDVASWRREEINRLFRILRLENARCLVRFGLYLPAICEEDDRKILPQPFVESRIAEIKRVK